MSEEQLKATKLGANDPINEFEDVEKLIQETLKESKAIQAKEKPVAAGLALPNENKPELKPQPQPQTPAKPAATYESTFKEYKAGDIVKGTVVKVDQKGVLVDIKYKADGLITLDELANRHFTSPDEIVKVGDNINVLIKELENKEGYVVLSKAKADSELQWKKAYDSFKNKTLLKAKVIQVLKGGLVVDSEGLRGFVPASQVAKKPGQSLEEFKDKIIPLKVLEINRHQGKIVFSNRLGAGEQEKLESQKIFDEIEVGQIRKGKVVNFKSFGAFVDLGGVEGLIHLSELAWKRVKHPSEALKIGETIDVFVLGVDKVNKKISLGLKELLPDPWEQATNHYKPGQVVKVKIVRFAKFGAFVELAHDLEGLIHNTELAKEPVRDPAAAVKIGDVVEAKVLRVIPEEQKIGLSIRDVLISKEREEIQPAAPAVPEQKVTIADMIAQKEKERAEEAAAQDEPI